MATQRSLSRLAGPLDPADPLDLATKSYVDGPTGLFAFRQAYTWRQFEPVNIVFVGASTFHGAAASIPDYAVPAQVGAMLRANDRTPSSIRGGVHIRADHPGWVTTGSLTDYPRDLGANVKELAAAATAQYSHLCDGYELYYLQGSTVGTSLGYQTDGGSTTAITPATVGTDTANGLRVVSSLSRASHAVKATATTGIARLSGIYFNDGDQAAGVRTFNAGKGGAKASWFSGLSVDTSTRYGALSNAARIAELKPALVVLGLGANDYASPQTDLVTYEAGMRNAVRLVQMGVNRPCSVLLVHQQLRLDVIAPTIPWSDYGAVLAKIAADTDDVDFLDLSHHFPAALSYDWDGLLDSAGVHPTNRGSAWMAELITEHLLRSVGAQSVQKSTPPVISDPEPSTLSGLKSAWRASDLAGADGSAVSSWAPYAGSDQKTLAQGTGARQPVLRTASSTFRGQKCVSFDGLVTNGDMMTCTWTSRINAPATVCLVARQLGVWGSVFSGFSGVVGTGGPYLGLLAAAGEQVMLFAAGATADPYAATAQVARSRWQVIVARFDGASSALFQTALTKQALPLDTTHANAGLTGFTLGGSSAANAGAQPMEVAELAVFGRALSDNEAEGVKRSWERKYGIDWVGRAA